MPVLRMKSLLARVERGETPELASLQLASATRSVFTGLREAFSCWGKQRLKMIDRLR